jgi:hypothetical protein
LEHATFLRASQATATNSYGDNKTEERNYSGAGLGVCLIVGGILDAGHFNIRPDQTGGPGLLPALLYRAILIGSVVLTMIGQG